MLTQEVFLGNDGSPSILLISIIPCPLCECLLSKIFGGCATLMYYYLLGLNKKEKHKGICTTSHVINSFFFKSMLLFVSHEVSMYTRAIYKQKGIRYKRNL